MITKIISGGQTGADQGALDFALEHGIQQETKEFLEKVFSRFSDNPEPEN